MVPDAPLPTEYGYDNYAAFNCSGPQMPVHDDVPRAIEFIEKCVAAEKPFFINLWIHEPHTPHYPKPEFLEKFRGSRSRGRPDLRRGAGPRGCPSRRVAGDVGPFRSER